MHGNVWNMNMSFASLITGECKHHMMKCLNKDKSIPDQLRGQLMDGLLGLMHQRCFILLERAALPRILGNFHVAELNAVGCPTSPTADPNISHRRTPGPGWVDWSIAQTFQSGRNAWEVSNIVI